MGKRYLIVGGAGFIGSHLADLLLQHGHEIRIYDSLLPQVHGQQGRWPSYLQAAVEMRQGDVRDAGKLSGALESVDGCSISLPGSASGKACTRSRTMSPPTSLAPQPCFSCSLSNRSSGWSSPRR